jgi:cysteine desulfurase / selenocysteine lyase
MPEIAALLSNEELRRHEFPVAEEKIYFAHAGVCPLPRRVAEAIGRYAADCMRQDQEQFVFHAVLSHVRELAARLLQAQPEEIALVGPTSLALSYVASGLNLRKNENIIIYFDDYPSNVYPWMALAQKGVQVRFLNVRELGRIRAVDVMGQIDENTRLVALASAHFISGFRIDLEAIGSFLRERNVLFCVDAIQTVGAFPVAAGQVDFLAADAHKWLLGPCGAGLLYVRESVRGRLNPPVYGWHNVQCPDYVAQEQVTFQPGPQKFEAGTHYLLGIVGLVAAMKLILETGVEQIGRELLRKRAWVVPALQGRGWTVVQAEAPPENASGIISFFHPEKDMAATHQKLTEAGIVTSLRVDRSGRKYLRLSPHFYNTDAELQRVVESL